MKYIKVTVEVYDTNHRGTISACKEQPLSDIVGVLSWLLYQVEYCFDTLRERGEF